MLRPPVGFTDVEPVEDADMKDCLTAFCLALVLSTGSTSCNADDPIPVPPDMELPAPPVRPEEPGDSSDPEAPDKNENSNHPGNTDPMYQNLMLNVGAASFSVTLENHAAATAFKALLPMTVQMSEMNGNEKYYYLPEDLPASPAAVGTIRAGDLMLYGSSCVVFFYETFRTPYRYTRLGRVDDPSGLAAALGSGNVTVAFGWR